MRILLRHLLANTVVVAALVTGMTGASAQANATNASAALKIEGFVVQPPFIAPAVPQSGFVIPKKKPDGRDPFFPKSDRVYTQDAPVKPVATPVAELTLKGISGTAEQPLAIINTTTFSAGEENDVMTKAGRMRIRCVEIDMAAGTVTVQIGGERRVLRLAPLR